MKHDGLRITKRPTDSVGLFVILNLSHLFANLDFERGAIQCH